MHCASRQAQPEQRVADQDRQRLAAARAAPQQLQRLARNEADLGEAAQRRRVDLGRGRAPPAPTVARAPFGSSFSSIGGRTHRGRQQGATNAHAK